MSTSTPQEQPVEGQDQQATPDPTIAVPQAVPPAQTPVTSTSAGQGAGTTPWANDLNAIFADQGVRGQVDQYMREKVQPYMTQLEQKAAQNEQAQNLWNSFEEDPIDTYVRITNELYGEEAAQQVLNTLQSQLNQQEAQPQQQQQEAPVDPRFESAMKFFEEEQANKLYEQEFDRVKAEPQNSDIAPYMDRLHTFVAAADGDFDRAAQDFRQFISEWGTPYDAQSPPPQETAPNVMGSDSGSGQPSAAPTERPHQTLDEAINDFMAEQRANREAPPVSG